MSLGADGKVACPYDTSHRLYPERLSIHMVKCINSIRYCNPKRYNEILRTMGVCR